MMCLSLFCVSIDGEGSTGLAITNLDDTLKLFVVNITQVLFKIEYQIIRVKGICAV